MHAGGETLKITAVHVYPMSIPRPRPSWTAHEISTEATLILVEVQTDAGVRGYGEIQGGPQPLICRLVVQCGEIICGMDALAHVDVWERLFALYVRLADAISIPLAHGEREWHRFTIRDFITSGALRFVQFDATRHAGFTEALRIAALAEQHRVCIAPHTAPHIHGHIVAAFGASAFAAESHGDPERNPIHHGLYTTGPIVRDGRLHLNDLPGFGVDIDWAFVKNIRPEPARHAVTIPA
jgi:L-alanine-DL-glutamate epimerase-like enolase superfamily enzyme